MASWSRSAASAGRCTSRRARRCTAPSRGTMSASNRTRRSLMEPSAAAPRPRVPVAPSLRTSSGNDGLLPSTDASQRRAHRRNWARPWRTAPRPAASQGRALERRASAVVRVLREGRRYRRLHEHHGSGRYVGPLRGSEPRSQHPVVDLARDGEAIERLRREVQAAIREAVRGAVYVRLIEGDHAVAVLINAGDLVGEGQQQAHAGIGHLGPEGPDPYEGAQQDLLVQRARDEAVAELLLRGIGGLRAVRIARVIGVVAVGELVVRHALWPRSRDAGGHVVLQPGRERPWDP